MTKTEFKKALAWFLQRVPLSGSEFALIEAEAEREAWLIANNIQLKLCQSVLDMIEEAQGESQPFDEFKTELVAWFP